jgi:hypothetical protein
MVSREFQWMGQFNWLSSRYASVIDSSLQYMNCSVGTSKVMYEFGDFVGIV